MAVACRFSSSSCSSQSLSVFRFSLRVGEQPRQLRCGTLRFSPWGDMVSDSSSTLGKSSRVGTEIRAKRSVKSNEELCNDLREFVSMVGFPEGHVPSLKELAEHGRKDLANIVRRRGYRLITELITSSTKEDTIAEMSSAENYEASDVYKDESFYTVVEGHDQEGNTLAEGLSLSSQVSDMEKYSSNTNGVLNPVPVTESESLEFSTDSSLQEKAAKFIQDGELEIVEGEGNGLNIGDEISSTTCENFEESDLEIDAESGLSQEKCSNSEATADNNSFIVNTRVLTSKMDLPLGMGHSAYREDFSSSEGIEFYERENQVEISRLKSMLHQKELELSQLKEQIEKEKLALSALQAKAEREIGKAQDIIMAKDEELLATEESLFGLKEVQIEYQGNGETVEMAGSFNGWHDRIKMDSHPASNGLNSTESRKSRLWSTVLWLYPGIYEIKFIVDGHWRIDTQREYVSRGTIQNNILRVDR